MPAPGPALLPGSTAAAPAASLWAAASRLRRRRPPRGAPARACLGRGRRRSDTAAISRHARRRGRSLVPVTLALLPGRYRRPWLALRRHEASTPSRRTRANPAPAVTVRSRPPPACWSFCWAPRIQRSCRQVCERHLRLRLAECRRRGPVLAAVLAAYRALAARTRLRPCGSSQRLHGPPRLRLRRRRRLLG